MTVAGPTPSPSIATKRNCTSTQLPSLVFFNTSTVSCLCTPQYLPPHWNDELSSMQYTMWPSGARYAPVSDISTAVKWTSSQHLQAHWHQNLPFLGAKSHYFHIASWWNLWSSAASWAAEMALCLSSIERSSKGTCAFSYSILNQP